MTMNLLTARRLLCLLLVTATASAQSCNEAVCDHGTCFEGVCQCDPNFTGPDCSIPFKTCPDDGRTCFNGSECVRENHKDPETGKYKYRCDCSKAFGVSPFAGLECENAATSSCQKDGNVDGNAFCTNDGECVKKVGKDDPHPGCICDSDFVGIHCQYRRGEAPEGEDLRIPASSSGGLGAVALFFVIVIPLAVIGLFAFVIWRKRQEEKEEPVISDATGDLGGDDLQLDENAADIEIT